MTDVYSLRNVNYFSCHFFNYFLKTELDKRQSVSFQYLKILQNKILLYKTDTVFSSLL